MRDWSIRALGRPLRRRSGAVDQLMTWQETWQVMARRPVLLYSMGRAGTTSLTDAITGQTDTELLKAHSLVPSRIRRRLRENPEPGRPRFWWQSQAMARYLRTHPRARWRVLSAVREPVARALSAHFYGTPGAGAPPLTATHAELSRGVERLLRAIALDEDWFREELIAVTGVDVYAVPFPHDRGWRTYRSDRFEIAVVRTEDLAGAGPDAFRDLVGSEATLQVPRRNENPRDEDTRLHRFVHEWRPDPGLLRAVYDTPLARHFYSDAERCELLERWTAR